MRKQYKKTIIFHLPLLPSGQELISGVIVRSEKDIHFVEALDSIRSYLNQHQGFGYYGTSDAPCVIADRMVEVIEIPFGDSLSDYTDEELKEELTRRRQQKKVKGENRWFEVDADMLETRGNAEIIEIDEIAIECGDWVWFDAEDRIRRTYGYAGGSHLRMHSFTAEGRCLQGWEARDALSDKSLSLSFLQDRDGVYPKIRELTETMPIEEE